MSVAKEFQEYLIANGVMTTANSFVSRTPTVSLSSNDQWAIVAQPGSINGGNILQWKRTHNLLVVYRNSDGEIVYNKDDVILALLNNACVTLDSYRVLRCIANPMTELPLDIKEVHVGQWSITLELVTKINEES